MSRRSKFGIFLFLLGIIILITLFSGSSPYAACRKVAMFKKSYSTWKHEGTDYHGNKSETTYVTFSDGTNALVCHANHFGPFWIASLATRQGLVGCETKHGMCLYEYYGVSP